MVKVTGILPRTSPAPPAPLSAAAVGGKNVPADDSPSRVVPPSSSVSVAPLSSQHGQASPLTAGPSRPLIGRWPVPLRRHSGTSLARRMSRHLLSSFVIFSQGEGCLGL